MNQSGKAFFIFLVFVALIGLAYVSGFGGPSPDTGSIFNGSVSGVYDAITGNYSDMEFDNNAYFGAQGTQTGPTSGRDLYMNMTLEYNVSVHSDDVNKTINRINGSLTYCHADSNSVGCAGGSSVVGTDVGQNIYVYNVSSGLYVDIGNITVTSDNIETVQTFEFPQNVSEFIDENGTIRMIYESNFEDGRSAFLVDLSELVVTYTTLGGNATTESIIERGSYWNKYNNTDGNHTLRIFLDSINYFDRCLTS